MLNLPAVLSQAQALQTAKALAMQIPAQAAAVVVNASALTQFDSAALAVLLDCRRAALAAGKTFAVSGLPPRLGQLAGLYGVSELVPAVTEV